MCIIYIQLFLFLFIHSLLLVYLFLQLLLADKFEVLGLDPLLQVFLPVQAARLYECRAALKTTAQQDQVGRKHGVLSDEEEIAHLDIGRDDLLSGAIFLRDQLDLLTVRFY